MAATRAAQARQVAEQAGLAADVADLFAAAATATAATFTVEYDFGSGGHSRVVQRPPNRMVDVVTAGGGETRFVATAKGSFSCQRAGNRWSCTAGGSPPEVGTFTPEAMQTAIQSLGSAAGSYDLRVETRQLLGFAARCLVATAKTGKAAQQVLCVAPDGVVLLTQGTSQAVTATSFRASATGSDFTLPARPS